MGSWNGDVRSGRGGDRGLALKDNDTVGKVGCHDEIVLDNESGLLRMQDESTTEFRLKNPLCMINGPTA